jgi:hypothetical protein
LKKITIAAFLSLTIFLLFSACSSTKNSYKGSLTSYQPVSKELYDTIAFMDSILFDAFNTRNFDKIKTLFSDSLEFYHDLGGVTNYDQNMNSFKKSFGNERKVRRELVKGSLEVYPIKDYGAVEIGIHRFYGTESGQKEKLGSEAKFLMVWQKKNNNWKISRVVSYGHLEQ